MFDPKVTVETSRSIFSLEIRASVVGLPPDEQMEYWLFDPSGDNAGVGIIESDNKGIFKTNSGDNSIYYKTTHSRPIMKGTYSLGINRKKYQGKERMTISLWRGLNCDKKLTDFVINYEKETFIKIQGEMQVPWGLGINVRGQLWFTNEQFPWCSGTTDMQNRKITITGTDVNTETLTDGFAKFNAQIPVGVYPKSECSLQAHYEGDPIFFDKCDSNIMYYKIIKHETSLILSIEPLIPNLSNILYKNESIINTGQFYLLKGRLNDKTINGPISEGIIKFSASEKLHLSSILTEEDGNFELYFQVPDSNETVTIEAVFEGNRFYAGTTTFVSFKIKKDSFSQISMFRQFDAINSFRNGFNDLKEQYQIRSSIWLLTLLGANPIPLGLFDKNGKGEQIMNDGNRLNYSADIISIFEGVPLVIDCTVAVPNSQKIDKIANAAEFLAKIFFRKFIPLIISNQPSSTMKREALMSNVLLLDQKDICEIVDLVLQNELSARQLFSKKIKEFFNSGNKE
jgi:hypothetical protein